MLDIILIILLTFGVIGVGAYFIFVRTVNQTLEITGLSNDQNHLQNGRRETGPLPTRQPLQPQPYTPIKLTQPPKLIATEIQEPEPTTPWGKLFKSLAENIKQPLNIVNQVKSGNIKGAASSGIDMAINLSPLGQLNQGLKIIPPNPVTNTVTKTIDKVAKKINPMSWF